MRLDTERRAALDRGFADAFGRQPRRYFSAPGRTEIGGNHTDHQRGKVLAASVTLDTVAAVAPNACGAIRVLSEGYPLCEIPLNQWAPVAAEQGTTAALIRGVAAGFAKMGCEISGFDVYCMSTVLPGSGLSSSASFEVLMGTIINGLFFHSRATAVEIARVGQQAENVYFGKPCGLMDQLACALGGLIAIDFGSKNLPQIRQVDFDFEAQGYGLCIIDTGADHGNLTAEYAAIPGELKQICDYFHKDVITQIPESEFYAAIPALRRRCGDRAVLRGIHEYQENRRVTAQLNALERGDFPGFLELVRESGRSSWMYLQNITPTGSVAHQDMAIALALCEKHLEGRGAFRVHGGGFGGTVQAYVPLDMQEDFRQGMEAVLGEGTCQVMAIRPEGAGELR